MSRALVALSLLAALGCGGDDEELTPLVVTTDEPAGDNCTHGGTAVVLGDDANGDGVLDEDEVISTDYVCNDGPTLVSLEAEDAGANCSSGGTAVHSGVDSNNNETLDEDEITSTRYVCDDVAPEDLVLNGDVTIENDIELALLRPFVEVTGTIGFFDAAVPADIELPYLRKAGAISLLNNGYTSLSFPSLEEVGTTLTIQGAGLTEIEFPALKTVGSTLSLTGMTALSTLDLSSLETTGGLGLSSLDGLTILDLPALTSAGSTSFIQCDDLMTISAGSLTNTTYFTIHENAALISLFFNALTTIDGNFAVIDNGMLPCNEVIALAAAATISGTTTISGNSGCP